MPPSVTYILRDDKTYAIHEGKVIAAAIDPDEVERQVKEAFGGDPGIPEQMHDYMQHGIEGEPHLPGDPWDGRPPKHGQICPDCGAPDDGSSPACRQCGAPLQQDLGHPGMEHGGLGPHDMPSPGHELGGEAGPYMANVVNTPNGLKGTVLGKVAGLWGDEVTVRLENGRIVKLPVGTELHTQKTAAAQSTPIERLETRLASTPDGTRESLVARADELQRIQRGASSLIRDGVSYADSVRLDQLVVTAEVEERSVAEAIEYLDDVESIAPPSFTMAAAHEAAGVSREDASWLDHTLDEMVKEAEATDFTKLMDEGPEAFTAELPDVALADTGVTRQMASSYITERTAGIAREIAEPYMETFLSRIEACRRDQLSTRKQVTHKEAAAAEDKYKDLPDDALFL